MITDLPSLSAERKETWKVYTKTVSVIKHAQIMNPTEIERRKLVWLALSEFYLDTDLQSADANRFLEVFKESGYSLNELKDIDFYEVKPIVGSNLWSTAGVWAGFNEDWLFEQIQKHTFGKKRKNNFFTRWRRKQFDSNRFSYWNKFEKVFKELAI